MKVLITADQLSRPSPGGIATYIHGLSLGLSQLEGVEVETWSGSLPSKLLTKAWEWGVAKPPVGYDVVHATSMSTPPNRNMPMTGMIHDLAWRAFPETFPERGRKWHEAALHRAIRRCRVVFTPSQHVADELIADSLVSPDRVVVAALGSDHLPQADNQSARQLLANKGVDGNYLLTVGTFEPRKNLERLIAAYEQVRDKLPQRLPLVIAGHGGWGDKVTPVDGVVFVEDIKGAEMAGLFAEASAVAYVSLKEGFGLPPLEAMSFGIPVVASRVPSVGDAALLVDPLSVEEIAQALLAVSADSSLQAELSSKSSARARDLTWKKCAQVHLDVWKSLS